MRTYTPSLPAATSNASDLKPQTDIPNRQVLLSQPQQLALEWLTTGGTLSEAAQFAGVCRQTVARWMREDPDFRAVYEAWREQVAEVTKGRLLALSQSAIDTLEYAVRDRRDVRAAQFVLKNTGMLEK